MIIKKGYAFCPECEKEFEEQEECIYCGSTSLEDCVSEEWKGMTEGKKLDYIQNKEDWAVWHSGV